MTPEQMAAVHARAFEGQGRPWSAGEFTALLNSPYVFYVGNASAFAVGRTIADEAELLTLATDPALQRQGLGRRTLQLFEIEAHHRGAESYFLEVAADNHPAIGLYQSAVYQEIARRNAYYEKPTGARVDALIFRKAIVS